MALCHNRPMAQLLRTYALNGAGRDYVVGDIHGQFQVLEALLAHIGFDVESDRLFAVGDLIDRGPDSHRVTAFLDAPWFHAILGNHEAMLLEAAYPVIDLPGARDNAPIWRVNGGGWFFDLTLPAQQAAYAAISQLPVAVEVALPDGRHAGLVHADIGRVAAQGRHWSLLSATPAATVAAGELNQVNDLLWSRELAAAVMRGVMTGTAVAVGIDGIDVVFFGHTPQAKPVRMANTRWLDTGAGYGERLSVAQLAVEGRVWSMAVTDRTVTAGWAGATE